MQGKSLVEEPGKHTGVSLVDASPPAVQADRTQVMTEAAPDAVEAGEKAAPEQIKAAMLDDPPQTKGDHEEANGGKDKSESSGPAGPKRFVGTYLSKKMAEKAEAKERPDQGHAVTAAVLKSLHLGHTPTYTLLYTYHVCTDTYIYIIYAHVAASRSHSYIHTPIYIIYVQIHTCI